MSAKSTKVYLVGAGPGHPGLITVRGRDVLRKADVVLYDCLANPRLLDGLRPCCERIYVGKQAGSHSMTQKEITDLLIEKARTASLLVRLKGGDPYVFGRGGEEALALAEAGIAFEIVPGVTAGTAALAYAGIPATHRGAATAVTFITGHEAADKDHADINWDALAGLHGTLVFYMGMQQLGGICSQLLAKGKPAETPAAVIRHGTLAGQQVVAGTLATIAGRVAAAGLKPPALIVVGDVVNLRPRLDWFGRLPLKGRRIVVTRSRAQASGLTQQLEQLGAEVLSFPTIQCIPPRSWDALDLALSGLSGFDWVIFPSANAVEGFFTRLYETGRDARSLAPAAVAAMGTGTAACLRQHGIIADLIPDEFHAEAAVQAFSAKDMQTCSVLLPRADKGRQILRAGLEKLGAMVIEAAVYKTVIDASADPDLLAMIRSGDFDLLTFSSSSTVRNFAELVGVDMLTRSTAACAIASIGPVTSSTAREYGLSVAIEAAQATVEGLVQAIVDFTRHDN